MPIYYPPIFYLTLFLIAQEDGTDIEFRNVGFYTSDAGEIPKRTQTTNVHLLVNELYEYQNARCNDKKLVVRISQKSNKAISTIRVLILEMPV